MTEHMHEWRFGYRSDGNYNLPGASTPGFYCVHKECGYASGTWLSLVEAEARLNATERLSAEDARVAANDLQQSRQVNELLTDIETIVTLRAYADIRDGKGGDDD